MKNALDAIDWSRLESRLGPVAERLRRMAAHFEQQR
jgi:hypothetical protein